MPEYELSCMNSSCVEILENLSRLCRSCAERFESAAAGCGDEQKHEKLVERAEQFGNYVWDLQEELSRFGRDRSGERLRMMISNEEGATDSSEASDTVHKDKPGVNCLECIESAESEYRRAMEERVVLEPLRKLLSRHHSEIQGALET
jgi:hypothetical protein